MYIFDAHVDTLSLLLEDRHQEEDLLTLTESHVNLEKLEKAKVSAQVFAIFVEPLFANGMALHRAMQMVDLFWQNIEKYKTRMEPVLCCDDLDRIHRLGKLASILWIEGGDPLQGELGNLRNFFRLGVRGLTLTWNNRNLLADGVGEGSNAGGLSEFGKQVISEMNDLGMVIDVSHLTDTGFWEVINLSKGPIVASHSNSRTIQPHRRNLTDEQIKALADKGGVMGLNFCPWFVSDHPHDPATVDHLMHHLTHIINVGGSECVGLGSDFDGIGATPRGLEDVTSIPSLPGLMLDQGFDYEQVEKVMGRNFYRVMQDILD